ncbi:general transcription factor 3C polypeptide 1 [Aulostomus maculatus]
MVEDEVALEGLDGITISSLWTRLEDRKPKFLLQLDDRTKEFIWKSLAANTELKFYELPLEREDVVLFHRFKETNSEAGTDTVRDIYPIHILLENKDGIQGSCALFKERKDITKHIRSKSFTALISLEEALERYGRKLVVVASQRLRFRTLIGNESDPDLKLSDDSYCMLERVGRSRWQGEIQSDLHRSSFKIDARKLHYLRKSLLRHGLVSLQHATRLKSGQQQHSILLLLKRFHVSRRSKYDLLMEFVSDLLQQTPGQFTTLITLKEQLKVKEGTLKRVLNYMRTAKLIELCRYPLEDIDNEEGPCLNKRGNKVLVRCLKLLKPYSRKGVVDEDEDDEDEDDDESGIRRGAFPPEGRIIEKDVLSQTYNLVLSCGTKGISKSGIACRMNIGKLEARMICRKLERDGMIKGFMVDVGRQRTTKYISHKCVGGSDQLQLFAKEQERQKLLYSSAPQTSSTASASSKTPSTSKLTAKESTRTPGVRKIRKTGKGGDEDEEEAGTLSFDKDMEADGAKVKGKPGRKRKNARKKGTVTENQPESSIIQPTPFECETPVCTSMIPESESVSRSEHPQTEEEEEASGSKTVGASPQSEAPKANSNPGERIVVVEDCCQQGVSSGDKKQRSMERSHETYRLLRRKNLIVEAVHSFKIIEGLFPLQKMINDEEKHNGFSSRCCKKTILRLVQSLSREGLIKMYTTTVIQDGISKKVDMVVHPSIQPSDEMVTRVIEQVRFKISSSYSALRMQHSEEKAKEEEAEEMNSVTQRGKAEKKKKVTKEEDFKPTTVRGLGKSLGFQPKMHRLRVMHTFLWYLIYGHPLQQTSTGSQPTSHTPTQPGNCKSDAKPPTTNLPGTIKDKLTSTNADKQTSVDPKNSDSTSSKLDVASSGDEEEEVNNKSSPGPAQSDMTAYSEEDSWKKFIPPVNRHKEYGSGWAMVGDLLLCLPLSVFIQIIQINYEVEGLEEYLNDPVKQHHLIRTLPARMRRKLLYRRRYIFIFHENLQRLIYMGLLQFCPMEKFKEKDQVFVYLRRNASIVDTTSSEPHYWLVSEPPDKPFERRQYTFNTAEDVENYWFDLMCVCLNTPLGVIRSKRNATDEESAPSFVHERYVFVGMAYLLKGSQEVCDDGSIPGDGKGAGGLHSEFFGHLKRNWLWTNRLLAVKTSPSGTEAAETKIRLKSLLSKNALRIALKAGGSTTPRYMTTKKSLIREESVEVTEEPSSRNQQVVGGKQQKRKRSKKEVIKVPRKKKKEPKKRTPAHDEVDHQALKMMTRRRVNWSLQEDSLMMLCSVASHLLNSKLKRPFVAHCVVRDLLQAEFEISLDKTSVAVGRRSRYILKNPQTFLNYRICLAEVYQDKALLRLLEENKPDDPDKPEDCAKAFSEYVRLLRQKFSAVMSACDMNIPDTKRQLFSRFKVVAIGSGKQASSKDTLNCTEDIHAIVLHNLIQSTLAMTNCQMKSSRSFQTFHTYSKYNQELLCQVFIQCRKRGLVNRRRVTQPFGPKKNRALPILPMSYQLSQSYYRLFSWRFPHSLCTDSFRFLRGLINNGTGDHRPGVTFYHETERRTESGEEVMERRKDKARDEKTDTGPVTGPEMQSKKMDSDTTQEDNNVSLLEETCLTAGFGECPSTVKETDSQPVKEKQLSEAVTVNAAPGESEEDPDLSDMMLYSLNSLGGSCVVSLSLMTLGLLSVHLSIPKQMVVVDSNLLDKDVVKSLAALEEEEDDDDDNEDCDGKKRMEVKAHQASHTKYLMMRGHYCPGIVKLRNLNTSDNIVVESCIIRLQLRDTPAHHLFTTENFPPLDFSKCGPSLVPSILTHFVPFSTWSSSSVEESDRRLMQQRGYSPQDIEACAQLRRSLDEAGDRGLDAQDVCQAHAHLQQPQSGRSRSLQQYMKDIQDEGQVVQVGSSGARWVHMKHADPWLLTVNLGNWSQSRLTSNRLSFMGNQHSLPFMRKRSMRREAEEPPAKKPPMEKEGENREDVDQSDTTEKPNGGEQLGNQNDEEEKESRNNLVDECPTQPEEEGEKEAEHDNVEIEESQERRSPRCRKQARKASADSERPVDLNEESLSFISRPWRMVDGKLNRQVCKGMLEAVLYHVMSRPGLTQQTLVDYYKNVLQPVAVMELVQALIEMGCVTRKTLVKKPKASLFGRPAPQTESEPKVKLEEADAVFYEPTISCCLRLSQVLPNECHWNCIIP